MQCSIPRTAVARVVIQPRGQAGLSSVYPPSQQDTITLRLHLTYTTEQRCKLFPQYNENESIWLAEGNPLFFESQAS